MDGSVCTEEVITVLACTLHEICLTLCGRVLLEKLTVAQPLRIYPAIDWTQSSLPCSQQRGTGIFLREMNPVHDLTIDSSGNHFNITLPSTSMSPKISLCPTKKFTYGACYACYISNQSCTSWFDRSNIIWCTGVYLHLKDYDIEVSAN
jgi:hypothetical protein